MRLVTRNIIVRIFRDIATAHYQIKSFGYGDELDYVQKDENEDTQTLETNTFYPRLFVSPDDYTIERGTIRRTYKIIVADRTEQGDFDYEEVESDTEQIIGDVIAQIQDQDYGFILDETNITITPFKDRFVDRVTGHMATVTIYSSFEYNRCQIPSSFISISSPYIPLNEEGTNERDPLSWHLAGNSLDYEAFLGTTSNQAWRMGTNSITYWRVEIDGTLSPNASGVTDIGTADKPVGTLYVDNIEGAFDNGVTSVAIDTGTTGTNVNVSGSPITSSGTITINIPDASTTARGLVTTAAQTIRGLKTFDNSADTNSFIAARFKSFFSATGSIATDNSAIWLGIGGSAAFQGAWVASATRLLARVNNTEFLRADSSGITLSNSTQGAAAATVNIIADAGKDPFLVQYDNGVTLDDVLQIDSSLNIIMANLPTSSAGLPSGALWNNSGVVNIV